MKKPRVHVLDLCGRCGLRTGNKSVKGILCAECFEEVGTTEELRPEENFGLTPVVEGEADSTEHITNLLTEEKNDEGT